MLQGKAVNVGGDMKGDGLQNGGALIVGPGGKLLLSFRQEGPAEHISNSKILQVLSPTKLYFDMPSNTKKFQVLGIKVPEGMSLDEQTTADAQCSK